MLRIPYSTPVFRLPKVRATPMVFLLRKFEFLRIFWQFSKDKKKLASKLWYVLLSVLDWFLSFPLFLKLWIWRYRKKKMVRIGAMGLVRFLPRQSEIQHSAQHRIFKKKKRMATKMIRDFRCHFLSFSNAWGCGIWTPQTSVANRWNKVGQLGPAALVATSI